MPAYNWSCFTKSININAAADRLYNAWATRGGIEEWFLRESEYKKKDGSVRNHNEQVQAGDTYKWLWHGWPDSAVEIGEIVAANGIDLFKFTFGGPVDDPIIVTIQLILQEGEQIVTLTQENIPLDEKSVTNYHIGCMEGWTFHLTNMKSIFEGGIDLKTRNEKLKVFNK